MLSNRGSGAPDKVIASQSSLWSYNGQGYACWVNGNNCVHLQGEHGGQSYLPNCIVSLLISWLFPPLKGATSFDCQGSNCWYQTNFEFICHLGSLRMRQLMRWWSNGEHIIFSKVFFLFPFLSFPLLFFFFFFFFLFLFLFFFFAAVLSSCKSDRPHIQ